jgi:urease subunit gamma/beta
MRLLPWEEDRILMFSAAELARQLRSRGVLLNHPEAVAIICDTMLTAARTGATYDEVIAAGRGAVREDQVIEGVRALVDEVRLEVLLEDGTRLIVLADPLGSFDPLAPDAGEPPAAPPSTRLRPGEVRLGQDPVELAAGRERVRVRVENMSSRVVRVSSHYPFARTNHRLSFDREAAAGCRLDIPAGESLRWAPGEVREVELVRYAGRAGRGARRDSVGGDA